MKTIKELSDQEQQEARSAEAYEMFKRAMDKLDSDHTNWVRRNAIRDRWFNIAFAAVLVSWALLAAFIILRSVPTR